MVSFSCETCGDVLTKKKLDPHRNRCRGATFTCIDCMVYFPGNEYRSHTTCMTEDQKYQGALYKPKKQKPGQGNQGPTQQKDNMYHTAYVQEAAEAAAEEWQDYEIHEADDEDTRSSAELPEAPTPPSAVPDEGQHNVFDFLVNSTPNASTMALPTQHLDMQQMQPAPPVRQLVRFHAREEDYIDPSAYMVDEQGMVTYADGTVAQMYETPAPKAHRKKSKDSDSKKDKKRKRGGELQINTAVQGHNDEEMTDAPPVLHSGLTGGLNRLMRPPQFPPSPDYSGGDAGDHSPGHVSPVKKTKKSSKHSKSHRSEGLSTGFRALIGGSSRTKTSSKKRKHSTERKEKTKKKKPHTRRSSSEKPPKMIEYRPTQDGENKDANAGQMVLYRPRSDLFLSYCNKGPESDRGCSVNKALKRFLRERASSEDSLGKHGEEKELWRSLRMRRNDRGEIVLFSIEED